VPGQADTGAQEDHREGTGRGDPEPLAGCSLPAEDGPDRSLDARIRHLAITWA
jgi:hypothetical protein